MHWMLVSSRLGRSVSPWDWINAHTGALGVPLHAKGILCERTPWELVKAIPMSEIFPTRWPALLRVTDEMHPSARISHCLSQFPVVASKACRAHHRSKSACDW